MVIDKKGKIFDDRRKENISVKRDRRKSSNKVNKNKIKDKE